MSEQMDESNSSRHAAVVSSEFRFTFLRSEFRGDSFADECGAQGEAGRADGTVAHWLGVFLESH